MRNQQFDILKKYFPDKAVPIVARYYQDMRFKLLFVAPRKTKLGDFRSPQNPGGICTITLNADMQPYNMTITFVHELAHYTTFVKYGQKVKPHGNEWKEQYRELMQPFLSNDVFPDVLLDAIHQHLQHIGASTYSDKELLRAIRALERQPEHYITLENLPENSLFRLHNGRTFIKGPRLRTRYKCQCTTTKRWYLIQGLCMVEPLTPS